MKVKILKDSTLTIKAGQVVDVAERDARNAVKMGLAEPVKETKKKGTK